MSSREKQLVVQLTLQTSTHDIKKSYNKPLGTFIVLCEGILVMANGSTIWRVSQNIEGSLAKGDQYTKNKKIFNITQTNTS
jgi:hypothetical protein